jgi:acetolactate synthase I/II/III large subunit
LTTAEILAATLKANGIRRFFGLPGGEIAEILSACRHLGLEFVLTRHENAAAIMAGVTGELTRQPGVVVATVGPGATNLVNGVATAFLERAPLLVISAQVPTSMAAVLPHQRVNLEELFRPITKSSRTLTGHDTAGTVQRAMDLAVEGRPGPVYLALPSDVSRLEERTPEEKGPPSGQMSYPSPPCPPSEAVSRAARMISEAHRPLAVVGIGLDPVETQESLLRWLDATRIPVAVSPKAKGLVPEDHPLFLATCAGMAGDRLFVELLQDADLLIGIGFDPTEAIRPFYLERPFVSVAAYSMAEPKFAPVIELIGNVSSTLDALTRETSVCHAWTLEALLTFRQRLANFLTPSLHQTQLGLSPAQLFGRLRDLVPRDAILTVDTGAHKLLLGQIWRSYQPRTYLVSHGLSTMGFALPAALAAKLEHPQRAVIAVSGDGGLAMVLAELETAARQRLPVVVVVLSDRSLHLIRLHQERKGFRASGVDFGSIDFAAIASGFGCRGLRVTTWPEFDTAVAAALGADHPTVIEVPVDPTDYNQML